MRLRLNVHPLARVAAALLALGIAGCGASGANHVHRTRSEPLESVFEAGPQLHTDPAATLDALRRLGVDRVKLFLPWANIAPDSASRRMPSGFDGANPAAYPAAELGDLRHDRARRRCSRDRARPHGRRAPAAVGAGIGGAPGRRTRSGSPQRASSAHSSGPSALATAGGTRPPGASRPLPRVSFWSIWNEPNYGPDLAPQATDHTLVEVSPQLYRGLLNAAWSALAATGHGHDTMLIGELAPRGQTGGNHPGDFDGMVPLRFIRALYCVDAAFKPSAGAGRKRPWMPVHGRRRQLRSRAPTRRCSTPAGSPTIPIRKGRHHRHS